ncbi:hypothetical protein KXR64_21795 [Brucella intermedia]|uniref:hypothetical protein n=1 Tax=Brucella TaxID=234 RepID=UPI00094687BD|nr:hypothetical protein [Brucella intermedia]
MNKTIYALLGTAVSFMICPDIASAAPYADFYINNKSQAVATYNPGLSNCFAEVKPEFEELKPGGIRKHKALSKVGNLFFCKITYEVDYRKCTFLLTRQQTQSCSLVTGLCKITWGHPQVTSPSGGAKCSGLITSVDDINAVATPDNGRFSATLTIN